MGEECSSRAPPEKEPSNHASMQEGASKETTATSKVIDEKELERLAVEALLEEAKRGKSRAEQVGAIGWSKTEFPKTNKRFLSSTLANAVSSNQKKSRLDDRHWHRSRDDPSRRERPRREHYHHRSRRSRSRSRSREDR